MLHNIVIHYNHTTKSDLIIKTHNLLANYSDFQYHQVITINDSCRSILAINRGHYGNLPHDNFLIEKMSFELIKSISINGLDHYVNKAPEPPNPYTNI